MDMLTFSLDWVIVCVVRFDLIAQSCSGTAVKPRVSRLES